MRWTRVDEVYFTLYRIMKIFSEMWCFYIQIAKKITKYPDFSRYVLKTIPFSFKPHPNPIAIFLTLPPSHRQPPSTIFHFFYPPSPPTVNKLFFLNPTSLPTVNTPSTIFDFQTHPPCPTQMMT